MLLDLSFPLQILVSTKIEFARGMDSLFSPSSDNVDRSKFATLFITLNLLPAGATEADRMKRKL
jgi:hypothetical protein